MINVSLPTPVLLDTQLREIAPKVGKTFEELESLMNGMSVLIANRDAQEDGEDGWTYAIAQSMVIDENNIAHLAYDPEQDGDQRTILSGAEAVMFLCKESGLDVTPVTEINLSAEVFRGAKPKAWYAICQHVARIETRVQRIEKLASLSAPPLIMFNENRMLYEAVCALEHNWIADAHRAPLTYADGSPLASLNTIGRSLVRTITPEERLLRAIFGNTVG